MPHFKEGDKSRALCSTCKAVVPTTFRTCDVPFAEGGGYVPAILAGVCDCCGSIVSTPAQATEAIKAALQRKAVPPGTRLFTSQSLAGALSLLNR